MGLQHQTPLPPLATPDPEIELAESQSGKRNSSGVCGQNPAKITTICLVILSMWIMLVLIMHLDKKMTLTESSMSRMVDKIENMEGTANTYRQGIGDSINTIEEQMDRILQAT